MQTTYLLIYLKQKNKKQKTKKKKERKEKVVSELTENQFRSIPIRLWRKSTCNKGWPIQDRTVTSFQITVSTGSVREISPGQQKESQ